MAEESGDRATHHPEPLGPIGRVLARAPRHLYRLGLGRLLGRRFVLIEHTGRKTGRTREAVVEVVRHDPASLDVAAAWGGRSDWYRNLVATPAALVSTGALRRRPAVASIVEVGDAATVFAAYARDHPWAARTLAKTFGLPVDDPVRMAEAVPLVRLRFEPGR